MLKFSKYSKKLQFFLLVILVGHFQNLTNASPLWNNSKNLERSLEINSFEISYEIRINNDGVFQGTSSSVKLEYWFDNDFSTRKWMNCNGSNGEMLSLNLNTIDLSTGLHQVNFRFKDSNGIFSTVNTAFFNKYPSRNGEQIQVSKYEFWLDQDYGNHQTIKVQPRELLNLNALDLTKWPSGFFQLNMRYCDNAGQWSSISSSNINILPHRQGNEPQIVRYEYWFNDQYEKRKVVQVTPGTTLEIPKLDLTGLSEGLYQIYMRYRDNVGHWSSVHQEWVQKLTGSSGAVNQVINYRYWIDNNFSSRISGTTPNSSNPYIFVKNIDPTGLGEGDHYLNIQFKDELNRWTTVTSLKIAQAVTAIPDITLNDPTNISSNSFAACWTVNDNATGYLIDIATDANFSSLIASRDVGQASSSQLDGLPVGVTCYVRVRPYNQYGTGNYSNTKTVTFLPAGTGCVFNDCKSPEECGEATYRAELYAAIKFLCERGIAEGINGEIRIKNTDLVTRGQLAKLAFFGVFNGEVNIPKMLVSDFFPNPFSDLQKPKESTKYYYNAARALVYLDHGDGIAPFDRDQQWFRPNYFISRRLVLKVLFETFNIKPSTSTEEVFEDFHPGDNLFGYAKRAKELGITTETHFRPEESCRRDEAFIFLYRIMNHAEKLIPKINNTLDLATSSFYVPANASIASMLGGWGIESGNFNHYTKSCFSIPGRNISLDFGFTYNSITTEFPGELYPIEPLGKGWSHTWNMYMNYFVDPDTEEIQIAVHMPDGQIMFYGVENGSTVPMTFGNYNTLTFDTITECRMTTKSQVVYTFKKLGENDAAYMLTSVKDRHNNEVSISYSEGPSYTAPGTQAVLTTRLISEVVDPTGRKLIFNYDSKSNHLASVMDPIRREVLFGYNYDNQLTQFTDAKQQITTYSYGTTAEETRLNLLRKIKMPKGNEITNEYLQRKLTSTQFNSNSPTLITHNPNYVAGKNNFYKSTITTPQQNGQVITTNYEMDALGNTTKVTGSNAVNISSTYTDSAHPKLPTSISNNLNNMSVEPAYDAQGNVITITTKGNGTTFTETFTYSNQNDLLEHTNANGHTTIYTYTGGNLTKVTDALNNETKIEYNQHGQPTQVTNPMENVVTFGYNQFGNQNKVDIPMLSLSASMQYDEVSRMVSATNFKGQTSTYDYDANDNLKTETDAMNHSTAYDYDANDNLKSITNAKGEPTTFEYDFLTDWLKTESFQGAVKTYNYNADGSLKSFTDPNQVSSNYIYDTAGRIKSDGYATYTYYANGNLESITRSGKAIYFNYDGLNRVSSISYDGQTVSYTYDNVGNLLTMTYPGGKVVTYTYDDLERMETVTDWNNQKTRYFYRSDGQLDYTLLPNDVKTAITYDYAGRPTALSSKRNNGTEIAGYTFTLDALGNHLSEEMKEPFDTYPELKDTTINYTYNNANRLLNANNTAFGYDNNGNTKSKIGYQFTYDDQDNLIAVSGKFNARYAYDGAGNRRQATRNGIVTKYVLDILGMSSVLMETDANNTPLNYYVYGLGLISRIKPDNTTHYYVYDYRGSTVAMVDATPNALVTHKYQYDEFGNLLQTTEADANLFRYVGKYGVMYEAEAIQFMRARYYDPSIGRFLSEDPVWSTNLYPYADNNPINKYDLNGLDYVCVDASFYNGVGANGSVCTVINGSEKGDVYLTVGVGAGVGGGGGVSIHPGTPKEGISVSAGCSAIGHNVGWNADENGISTDYFVSTPSLSIECSATINNTIKINKKGGEPYAKSSQYGAGYVNNKIIEPKTKTNQTAKKTKKTKSNNNSKVGAGSVASRPK